MSQQRYLPFGQVRTDVGSITQTDFGYTGQRDVPNLGLMDYRARFYDSYITRFVQPDSITPGGPQGLNRYAYGFNNPSRYTDPSGHMVCNVMVSGSAPVDEDACESAQRNRNPDYAGPLDYQRPGLPVNVHRQGNGLKADNESSVVLWEDTNTECPGGADSCVGQITEYASISLGTAIPNDITGTAVGWHMTITVDRFGRVYFGLGLDAGKSLFLISGNVVAGSFTADQVPDSIDAEKKFLEAFITGDTVQAGLVPIYYTGINWSPSAGEAAWENGIGVPAGFVSWTHTFDR